MATTPRTQNSFVRSFRSFRLSLGAFLGRLFLALVSIIHHIMAGINSILLSFEALIQRVAAITLIGLCGSAIPVLAFQFAKKMRLTEPIPDNYACIIAIGLAAATAFLLGYEQTKIGSGLYFGIVIWILMIERLGDVIPDVTKFFPNLEERIWPLVLVCSLGVAILFSIYPVKKKPIAP